MRHLNFQMVALSALEAPIIVAKINHAHGGKWTLANIKKPRPTNSLLKPNPQSYLLIENYQ
jgi:hypothetical protein